MDVLYEDNHLIAVSKPRNILSQPSPDSDDSVETFLKQYIKEKYKKSGEVFLHVTHRLDKPVSGIVLCARTSKALSRLNVQQRQKEMKKVYLALVTGALPEKEGALEHDLVKKSFKSLAFPRGKAPRKEDFKEAKLLYKVLKKVGSRTLIAVRLLTGRYHQIRAQLSAVGCPIVADTKYGGEQSNKFTKGIALHHYQLTFKHPVQGTLLDLHTQSVWSKEFLSDSDLKEALLSF